MKKLTFENFKNITIRKPLIVCVNDPIENFYIKIAVTEVGEYCIDMFFDQELKTENNRIFTQEEIFRFGSILLKIYKFINMIKEKIK